MTLVAGGFAIAGCRSQSAKPDQPSADPGLAKSAAAAEPPAPPRPEIKANGPKIAALSLRTEVFDRPDHGARKLGYLRLGEAVGRSEKPVPGDKCPEGWYAVEPAGYICAGEDATLDLGHRIIRALGIKPDLSKPMPYQYGFVRANSALYHQVPKKQEQEKFEFGVSEHLKGFRKFHTKWNAIDKAGANHVPLDAEGNATIPAKSPPPTPPQIDEDNLFGMLEDGDTPWWLRGRRQIPNISTFKAPEYSIFNGKIQRHAGVAVLGSFKGDEKSGNRKFTVLLDGRLIGEDKIKPHYASPFHGIPLDGKQKFPFAMVRRETAWFYEDNNTPKWKRRGEAEFREIYQLTGNVKKYNSTKYYETEDGHWLKYEEISVFDKPDPPKTFEWEKEKWIDVSIWQQTLVMYEGDKPVYATLVSTGKDGMGDPETTASTVRGEFRIDYKHVTATMDADDPENKFELRDVPWVQYFERGYALHAAYWHDDFGRPRSHGCINLSPIDARRLFFWTEPKLPPHWHGVKTEPAMGQGTWVRVRG
ncbi:MAG: L,D-transpeptidase [Polyangiaceae bacterium]